MASLLTLAAVSNAQDDSTLHAQVCAGLSDEQVDSFLFKEFNNRYASDGYPPLSLVTYGVSYVKDAGLKFFEREGCIFKFANEKNEQKLINQQLATIIAEKRQNEDFSGLTVEEYLEITGVEDQQKIPSQSYIDQFTGAISDYDVVQCEEDGCSVDETNFRAASDASLACGMDDDDCTFHDLVTYPTTTTDEETGSGGTTAAEEPTTTPKRKEEDTGMPTWAIIVITLVVIIIIASILFGYLLYQDSKKEERQVTVKNTNAPDFS